MIHGYYERIARFLRRATHQPVLSDPVYISRMIGLLIASGWTRDQIQREALRTEDVIIREDLFPEEVQR